MYSVCMGETGGWLCMRCVMLIKHSQMYVLSIVCAYFVSCGCNWASMGSALPPRYRYAGAYLTAGPQTIRCSCVQ
jgi:hypothetical protein